MSFSLQKKTIDSNAPRFFIHLPPFCFQTLVGLQAKHEVRSGALEHTDNRRSTKRRAKLPAQCNLAFTLPLLPPINSF